MLNFVKSFKKLIPEQIQFFILIVLSGIAVIVEVQAQTGFFNFIEALLPVSLLIAAVMIIQMKKETMWAHLILLFVFFADYFGQIIRAIFSYNFGSNAFTTKITFWMFVCAVCSIYLILMTASYLFEGNIKFNYKKTIVIFPLLLMIVYAYFRFGFNVALLWTFPVGVALLIGSPFAGILLIIMNFISSPFSFIDTIFNGTFRFTSVNYWVFLLFGFAILAVSILSISQIILDTKKQIT